MKDGGSECSVGSTER